MTEDLITDKSNQIEMLKKSWKHLYLRLIQTSVSIHRLKSPNKRMPSSRAFSPTRIKIFRITVSILIETQSSRISYERVKPTVGYNFRGIGFFAGGHTILLTLITMYYPSSSPTSKH